MNYRRIRLKPLLHTIAVQLSPKCSNRCLYCSLPEVHRQQSAILSRLTELIDFVTGLLDLHDERFEIVKPLTILLRGGEPLEVPISLMTEFFGGLETHLGDSVQISVQTSGIGLTEQWISVLGRKGVKVGLSTDCPPGWPSERRTNSRGELENVARRAALSLREANIPFGIISVATPAILGFNGFDITTYYDYFVDLGAEALHVNIEGFRGANRREPLDTPLVVQFWQNLFIEHYLRRKGLKQGAFLPIRNLEITEQRISSWVAKGGHSVLQSLNVPILTEGQLRIDLNPYVLNTGNIAFLSGEFLSGSAEKDTSFVVSDLSKTPEDILQDGFQAWYFRQHESGINLCAQTCDMFPICGGHFPDAKYAQHATLEATNTHACELGLQAMFLGIGSAYKILTETGQLRGNLSNNTADTINL